MKKNFVKIACAAAFAIAAGYSVYTAQTATNLSDLALDNIEALAYSVEGEHSNYNCSAPWDVTCSTELGVNLSGTRN